MSWNGLKYFEMLGNGVALRMKQIAILGNGLKRPAEMPEYSVHSRRYCSARFEVANPNVYTCLYQFQKFKIWLNGRLRRFNYLASSAGQRRSGCSASHLQVLPQSSTKRLGSSTNSTFLTVSRQPGCVLLALPLASAYRFRADRLLPWAQLPLVEQKRCGMVI